MALVNGNVDMDIYFKTEFPTKGLSGDIESLLKEHIKGELLESEEMRNHMDNVLPLSYFQIIGMPEIEVDNLLENMQPISFYVDEDGLKVMTGFEYSCGAHSQDCKYADECNIYIMVDGDDDSDDGHLRVAINWSIWIDNIYNRSSEEIKELVKTQAEIGIDIEDSELGLYEAVDDYFTLPQVKEASEREAPNRDKFKGTLLHKLGGLESS